MDNEILTDGLLEDAESISDNDYSVITVDIDSIPSEELRFYLQELVDQLSELQEEHKNSNDYLETVSETIEQDHAYDLFNKPLAEYSVLEGMTLLSMFFLLCLVIWKVLEMVNWRR